MPEALILEFTGVSEAEYAAVNKHLGIDIHTGHEGTGPPGCSRTPPGRRTTARSSCRRCGRRGPTRTRS